MLGFFCGLAYSVAQAGERIVFGTPIPFEAKVHDADFETHTSYRDGESRRDTYLKVVFRFPPRNGSEQFICRRKVSSNPFTGTPYNEDALLRKWSLGGTHTLYESSKHPRIFRLDDPRPLIPAFTALGVLCLAGAIVTIIMLVKLRQFVGT